MRYAWHDNGCTQCVLIRSSRFDTQLGDDHRVRSSLPCTSRQLSISETELMFLVNAFHLNLMIGINLHPVLRVVNIKMWKRLKLIAETHVSLMFADFIKILVLNLVRPLINTYWTVWYTLYTIRTSLLIDELTIKAGIKLWNFQNFFLEQQLA